MKSRGSAWSRKKGVGSSEKREWLREWRNGRKEKGGHSGQRRKEGVADIR